MRFSTTAILLAAAASVRAWGGSWSDSTIKTFPCLTETELDNKVPACVRACQKAALAADGCWNYEDVACHCSNTGVVTPLINACLAQSKCTDKDITDMQNVIIPVCIYFNATTSGALASPWCAAAPIISSHPPAVTQAPLIPRGITSGNSTITPTSTLTTKTTKNAAMPTGVVEGGMLVLGVAAAFVL